MNRLVQPPSSNISHPLPDGRMTVIGGDKKVKNLTSMSTNTESRPIIQTDPRLGEYSGLELTT